MSACAGRIFRSEHFNLSLRKNEKGSQKPLRYKELFEQRQSADPHKAEPHTRHASIHNALLLRSPIISTILPTPKDRMERAARDHHEMAQQAALVAQEQAAKAASAAKFGNSGGVAAVAPAAPVQTGYVEGEEAMDAEIAAAASAFGALVG